MNCCRPLGKLVLSKRWFKIRVSCCKPFGGARILQDDQIQQLVAENTKCDMVQATRQTSLQRTPLRHMNSTTMWKTTTHANVQTLLHSQCCVRIGCTCSRGWRCPRNGHRRSRNLLVEVMMTQRWPNKPTYTRTLRVLAGRPRAAGNQ